MFVARLIQVCLKAIPYWQKKEIQKFLEHFTAFIGLEMWYRAKLDMAERKKRCTCGAFDDE